MALKTVASLGKEKYERIGSTKAKEILRGLDYMTRSKLKAEAVNLGTGRISVLNFIKHIDKTHGATAASKLISATKKHFNDGIDEAIKQKNINRIRRERAEDEDRGTYTKQYAGGREVESHGVRSVKEHGTMKNLNVGWDRPGIKTGGFASEYNKKSPDNPAPSKAPPIGIKPLGM